MSYFLRYKDLFLILGDFHHFILLKSIQGNGQCSMTCLFTDLGNSDNIKYNYLQIIKIDE